MEENDNKLENIFFKNILQNRLFNAEIFNIYDFINSQNISREDKIHLNDKFFGAGLSEEDHEIEELLKIIRNDEIKGHLLYKLIFELVEDIFDVHDDDHLDILLSDIHEEVETDIIYFLRDILEAIHKELKKKFSKKESINEFFSDDYLEDNELDKLLDEIDIYFSELIVVIKGSDEKKMIINKIETNIKEHELIFEIK